VNGLRADLCPVCGRPNDCGLAAGKSDCWCASINISPAALDRVPDEAKGKICICARCAGAKAAKVIPFTQELK